jgi:hypothetical protein
MIVSSVEAELDCGGGRRAEKKSLIFLPFLSFVFDLRLS